jgi:hypothetical protein
MHDRLHTFLKGIWLYMCACLLVVLWTYVYCFWKY